MLSSRFFINTEISCAASALTEIESILFLNKNSAISFLLPACPQILDLTLCFTQLSKTFLISEKIAGFNSLYKSCTESSPLSTARVNCVKSFVPKETK